MTDAERFLSSFAPSPTALALPDRGEACVWSAGRAAALFVDVVGFSALADRLAGEREAEGADELARLMNLGFEFMIDAVAQQGGEIADLGGDSLLALWPVDAPAREPERCRAALACAQALLDGIAEVPSPEGHRWELHLGMGLGDVVTARIGGVRGRWEALAAGPVLRELREAFEKAPPGTGVVSPRLWEALGAAAAELEAERLTGGFRRLHRRSGAAPPPPAEPAARPQAGLETVRGFLPLPVRSLVDARIPLSRWLAQIRTVTVLFLRIADLDAGSAEGVEALHRAVRTMQEVIHPLGGALNDVTADDKGTTALAVFGLTPGPEAYDPHHALRGALELAARLEGWAGSFGLGVATGKVFCGPIGNDLRRQYTIKGRVVNLAARLAAEAPGEVACDDASRRMASSRLAFDALPALAPKGFRTPVPRWRPRPAPGPASPAPLRKSGLFGRERELQSAAEQLLGGGSGEPGADCRTLVLEGVAGVGKSRLAAELVALAGQRGFRCVLVHADPAGQAGPYAVWRHALARLWPAGVLDALAEAGLDPAWAPLLNPVSGLDLVDTPETAGLDAAARASRTRALLVELLGLAVRRSRDRVLLVIEDAYWMDAASWELALALAASGPPLALLLTLRPTVRGPEETLGRLRRLPNSMTLVLDSLGASATTALVEATLGAAGVPEAVAGWVFRVSEGNPFFARELCLALRDRGDLRVVDGRVARAPEPSELEQLPLPYSVEAVVTHRIDRLAPGDQLLLKCASVMGPEFDPEGLGILSAGTAESSELAGGERVGAGLLRLIQADLVTEPDPVGGTGFRFKHDITWRVAYDLLPRRQRRTLHAAVAEWYERTHAAAIPLILPKLATHWQRAEVGPKAALYLSRAGEAAMQAGAHGEAVRYLRDALAVEDPGLPDREAAAARAAWEQSLGVALWSLGDLRAAEHHASRALEHVGYRLPRARAGWALALARQLAAHGPSFLPRGAPAPGRLRALRTGAAAALVATDVHYFRADLLPLVTCGLLSVNLSERMRDPAPAAKAYGILGILAGVARLDRLARFYFERPRPACRARGEWVGLHSSLGAEAVWHVAFGRHAEAERVLEETEALCRRVGDPQNIELALTVRGLWDYNRGRFARSLEAFAEIHRSARDRANVQLEAWGAYAMGQNLLRMGRPAEALRLFEPARRQLAGRDDQHSRKICDGLIAQARLELGDLDGARRAAAEAAGRLVAANNFGSLEGHAGPAEVFARLAGLEPDARARAELRRRARDGLRDLARFARPFPIGRPRLALCRGLLAASDGPGRGRRAWLRGLPVAQRLGMPFEEARLHQCLAELGGLEARSAARHRERAAALAAACGAPVRPLHPTPTGGPP